jgi:S-DNA-T family DNA segregation ATPase FtsK/SpoIIIE
VTRIPAPAATADRATRGWTLVSPGGAADVVVTAADDATLGDVLPELGREPGLELWAGSTRLRADTPLTVPQLAHGAVLGVGGPAPRWSAGARSSALELHVVGGPDAGRTVPLGQGRHVLGRGGEATVRLDDPDVSRRHVEVNVGGGRITVADLSSTNGSRLDDRDLDERPVSWPAGAVLRLGASAVRLAGPGGVAAAVEPGTGGRMRLRPPRRPTTLRPAVDVAFPRLPEPARPRRAGRVAVAVDTWLPGRRPERTDAADYALELLGAQDRLADALRAGVRAAEAASPDLATLMSAARRRSHPLWSRSRGDADALTVRLGSGPGHVGVTRIDPEGCRHPEVAPHVPAVVDLRTSGGLAVLGPREQAVGVLRGVLAQLTALHAPGEVGLVLLPGTGRLADWAWARWLPHLDAEAGHRRRADRHSGATPWVDEVLAEVVARRRAGRGTPGWLVVVVDRPLDARLAAMLGQARDVGVVTLAAAASAENLPVAVDAALRLTGETGAQGVLGRGAAPGTGSVLVDRLPHAVARQFARDLAALVPATAVPG